jgi:hypothetical protein
VDLAPGPGARDDYTAFRPTFCAEYAATLQSNAAPTRSFVDSANLPENYDAAIALTAEPSCKDEARVGQKNGITRRWARRGTRPSAPKDQRTASAYIYGAICPAEGKSAVLVLPRCNTQGMALHLAEISAAVAPGAHAILLLDQAGWHGSS